MLIGSVREPAKGGAVYVETVQGQDTSHTKPGCNRTAD